VWLKMNHVKILNPDSDVWGVTSLRREAVSKKRGVGRGRMPERTLPGHEFPANPMDL
jgi:hypothetical protein